MRSWRRACAVVAVPPLLVVTSACLAETSAPIGEEPASSHPSAAGAPDAVSIRLVVSGGIAGTREVYTVGRDDDGGAENTRQDRIMALAGDPAVRGLASERSRGSVPCCDLRVFEVVIRYADGTRTHIETPETRTGPPELRRLLTLITAAG